MNADDPRHGTYAGFMAHLSSNSEICTSCKAARLRYNKRLRLDHLRGQRRTMPILGSRRRLQALSCLGYSLGELARELDVSKQRVAQWLGDERYQRIYPATADKLAELYERLCMTPSANPYASRVKESARAKGWKPPLFWDDIDAREIPSMVIYKDGSADVDEVMVDKIVGGEFHLARRATPAERRLVTARWTASGRGANELARATGWNVQRYYSRADAVA